MFTVTSCESDEEPVLIPPTAENAKFTFSYDPDNPNRVIFTGQPDVETWYTHWDFGDNSAAEGNEVSRIYPISGEYEVRFKIFTESGTAYSTQIVAIEFDLIGPNLVENGTMDSEASWTILPISGGVEVTFADGGATWTGGGWGHVGIYQEIEIEGDKLYQIDMEVSGGGLSDVWFEVYMGTAAPSPGNDYTDGGIRLGLNTWDGCGVDPFDGLLTLLTCSNGGGNGTFEFPNDVTAYLVIRSGGGNFGTDGVFIDNVTVRSVE